MGHAACMFDKSVRAPGGPRPAQLAVAVTHARAWKSEGRSWLVKKLLLVIVCPRSLGHACAACIFNLMRLYLRSFGQAPHAVMVPSALVAIMHERHPGNGGAYMVARCVLAPPPGQQRGRQPQDVAAP